MISYGGYDIFYSSSPFNKTSFSKNVGPKVNSYIDDISIFVSDNIFMLRYSYDEYSKIDQMSAKFSLFEDFIKNRLLNNYLSPE